MDPLQADDPRRIGAYRLLGRLGSGGMGTVYLGRSPAGLPVAVKLVHTEIADDPAFRTRFAREVTAARAVSGAFTAPVIDADAGARNPWLVTAFLRGMTLHDAIAEYGPFPIPAVFALGAGLAEALVGIHRAGVVHRDLKPANVMLAPDGPRVIDFGIAHAADAAVVTRTGALIGSPGFLAPEQAAGGATGPAGDVFALGAVLTFAATGEGPFGRGSAPALIYRVVHDAPRIDGIADPELRALVAACLDKNPYNRPDAASLLDRLAPHAPGPHALQGTGWLPDAVAGGIAAADRPVDTAPSRRRFLAIGGGAAAVVAVAGGTVAATTLSRSGGKPSAPATQPPPPPTPTPTPTPKDAVQRWTREVTGDPYGGLTAGGGLVVVSGDQGRLYGLDAATGRRRWQRKVGDRGAGAASWRTPVISGRSLYVGWPDTPGVLYAFDLATGRERWTYKVTFDARNPVVAGRVVCVGGGDGRLHAVDAATGAPRWRRAIGDVLNAEPCASGGVVYADTTKALYALDAATGHVRWSRAMPGGAVGPVASGGVVYCSDDQGELFALDARDGRQRWRFTGGTSVGRPYAGGGLVYVADGSGNLNALDAATGTVRWRYHAGDQTGDQEIGRAMAGDGIACVPTKTDLIGVDAATGRPGWRRNTGGEIRGTALAYGMAYAACETGRIYAFAAKEA